MTTATLTAAEAHITIEDFAKSKADSKVRVVPSIPIGKSIRQGDVYLTRIKSLPKDFVETDNMQLAPGTTQGSRHIMVNAKVYKNPKARNTEGPIVVAKERCLLEHPEHAHFDLPAGTYQVTYQLDYATQQRVND